MDGFTFHLVLVKDVFDGLPLLNLILHLNFALITKLGKWISRPTYIANVLKMELNLEIWVNLVTGGYRVRVNTFLIKGVYVVLLLNKGGVYSKSAYLLSILGVDQSEKDVSCQLNIGLNLDHHNVRIDLLCLVGQFLEIGRLQKLLVGLVVRVVGVDHFIIFTVHYFNTGLDRVTSDTGYGQDHNLLDSFKTWTLDFPLEHLLEVLDVPLLTWLGNAPASVKPLPSVISHGICEII